MPRIAAIEVTDAGMKVAVMSWTRRDPAALERAIVLEFGDKAPGPEGAVAREALVRERIRLREKLGPCDAALVLPRQQCVTKLVRLPSSDSAELDEMARYEADRIISYNRDQHVVSSETVSLDAVAGSDVMLAAVDDSAVRPAIMLSRAAGCEPMFAEVSSVSLARSFVSIHGHDAAREPILLLNLGVQHTEIAILQGDRVITSRAVLHGLRSLRQQLQETDNAFSSADPRANERLMAAMQTAGVSAAAGRRLSTEQLMLLDLREPDTIPIDAGAVLGPQSTTDVGNIVRAWLQKLVAQVRQTVEFARNEQTIQTPLRAYICGDGARMRGMVESLAGALAIEVQPFNPLGKIWPSPALPAGEAEGLISLATLHGALLRLRDEIDKRNEGETRINLLPADIIAQQRQQERKVLLTISATFAVISLVLVWLLFEGRHQYAQERAESFQSSIKVMAPHVAELKEKERKIGIIQRIRSDQASALFLLNSISTYKLLNTEPEGGKVTLMDFKFTSDQEVQIMGLALAIQDINNFVSYLRDLRAGQKPFFVKVLTSKQQTTTLTGRDSGVYEFTIAGELEKPPKERR